MHLSKPAIGRQGGARILLVEDETLVRIALAEDLRAAGFSVVEAATAEEALDYLRAGEVDLVFSDIQMPSSFDGLGLARRCRRDYPTLPVILTSAGVQPRQLEGASMFIPKPCSDKVAVEAINEALRLNAAGETG